MKIDKAKIKYTPPTKDKNPTQRASVYTEEFRGEFYNIKVEKLIPFKNQARKTFDEESIHSLAATIREHGIRQPLTIVPSKNDGLYEVVSGERRLRAALHLGLTSVPCIIIHDVTKAEEIAIIENIQRKDLHPLELSDALASLLSAGVFDSMMQIADKLGMHKSAVVEALNLQKLNSDVKEKLLSTQIKSRSLLRELTKTPLNLQLRVLEKFILSQENEKSDKTQAIKNSPRTQRQVFNIILDNNNELVLNVNKINSLNKAHKAQLQQILKNIINE